ncbi:MAG: GntR family transcriptional regulator [Lentisphaeria bacterium]|nr:GntR family transcriptional regulator [Lentisphaeria bacterium]
MIRRKHQQLFDILLEELRQGVWPKGSKLPSLKELSSQYDVSVNVAAKAIDMLKKGGLVDAKVGDGIYSRTDSPERLLEFKCSGKRLFGRYRGGKILRLLIEDSAEWQRKFWNLFFERVSCKFPDIELKIYYNLGEPDCASGEFDMAFGSSSFIQRSGFSEANCFGAELLRRFYPHLYADTLLSPGHSGLDCVPHLFPYGVLDIQLLSHQALTPPLPNENVVAYLERLGKCADSPIGYSIFNFEFFLLNCGLQFWCSDKGRFKLPDKDLLLDVFHRCKRLYQAGHLIWLHGQFSNYEEIYALKTEHPIKIVELLYNRRNLIEGLSFGQEGNCLQLRPEGEKMQLTPLFAAIRQHCPFPEECLRLLKELLDASSQKRMFQAGVAQPIHRLAQKQGEPLARHLQENTVIHYVQCDRDYENLMRSLVGWEFFYFLRGIRKSEVADLLEAKVKYYLQAKGRQ